MTPQQINERIALLCGWTSKEETIERVSAGYDWTEKYTTWSHPGKGRHLKPPSYAESLDACREFESPLYNGDLDSEMSQYMIHLGDVVKADESGWSWKYFRLATATPHERCEAFLRMKGQWDEN